MKLQNGKHLSFPFRVGDNGRIATVKTMEEHVRDELVQLILTNPGERPFLVEFGGGVRRLIFEFADDATASIAKANITQAVETWIGHRAVLENIEVEAFGSTISVDITYRPAGTEDPRVVRFQHDG